MMLAALQLWAGGNALPSLFSKMGDPLFAYAQKAKILNSDPALGQDAVTFAARADVVRTAGLAAEKTPQSGAGSDYLKQLRGLQKTYDRLMIKVRREMLASMKAEDTARLMQLASTEPSVVNEDRRLREKLRAYYEAKGLAGRSHILDRMVSKKTQGEIRYKQGDESVFYEADFVQRTGYRPSVRTPAKTSTKKRSTQKRSTQKRSGRKQVVVLGTPTCPYCKKARRFLRAQGIPFRDLNVNTSAEGQRLYKQYNGHGVPLILVDDTRISGFNPAAILMAVGR
jgi:glutaredoxin